MNVTSAEYITSSTSVAGCPKESLPEYAFIGRSNVGKSSLINMLTGRKKLARTSSTPGKTRLINHYRINDSWFLADLPGYGYAKFSKKEREILQKLVRRYALERKNLVSFFVLVDSRIPPRPIDLDFIRWLGENRVPFVIVLTKTDKVNQKERSLHRRLLEEALSEQWAELPLILESSAVKGNGRDEILEYIAQTNEALR